MTQDSPPRGHVKPLKEAREGMGYTQQALATAAGLSIATIRDLEQHIRVRVRDRTWNTLCDLLLVASGQYAQLLEAYR